MSEYYIDVTLCDDLGDNCQATISIPSTDLPVSDGWFGLEPGSDEYWDVVTSFAILMGVVWSTKAIVKFIRK